MLQWSPLSLLSVISIFNAFNAIKAQWLSINKKDDVLREQIQFALGNEPFPWPARPCLFLIHSSCRAYFTPRLRDPGGSQSSMRIMRGSSRKHRIQMDTNAKKFTGLGIRRTILRRY